ncbi:MAG: hypothetical protein K2R98_33455 [Gemmataceae bacterium]|nr:hypothetical protein [Gemmataceae bacterium]
MKIFLSFLPWIAFSALANGESLRVAAPVAFALCMVTLVPDLLRRRLRILDLATVGFFLAVTAAALLWPELESWKEWASTAGNAVLAALILGTNLAGTPFTLAYARESAPPEMHDSPGLRAVCLIISWAWFVAVAVMACGSWLGQVWEEMPMWLHWAIPVAAVVAATRFTSWYAERARRAGSERARSESSGNP